MFTSAFLALVITDTVVTSGVHGTLPNIDFKNRGYDEILQFFDILQKEHGDIVETFDALDRWPHIAPNVPKSDLPQCGGTACKWLVVHITNKTSYNELTPEMYISGCLHGDERVGPSIVTEYAGFLAAEYANKNPQITHLLNTRSLWMTPMTNAMGYSENERREKAPTETQFALGGFDPNRDFPYNDFYQDGNRSCMKTIAARVIAELYKHQMILFSLTLHAGTSELAYLWGSPPHAREVYTSATLPMRCRQRCASSQDGEGCCASRDAPDLSAFKAIGHSMWLAYGQTDNATCHSGGSNTNPTARGFHVQGFSGCWYFKRPEPSTNNVYAVNGGLEDFSYAYSWEHTLHTEAEPQKYKNPIPPLCSSGRYGGYRMAATDWNQSVKQLVFLIETNDDKNETRNYGNSGQVFRHPSVNDGHVARHIRTFIRVLELLRPEVILNSTSNTVYGIGCHTIEARLVKLVPPAPGYTCSTYVPSGRAATSIHSVIHRFPVTACRGLQLWRSTVEEQAHLPENSTIAIPADLELDSCYAIVASFDGEWADQSGTAPHPKVAPQSHLVRARTERTYVVPNARRNGSRIQADKDHFVPLTYINPNVNGSMCQHRKCIAEWKFNGVKQPPCSNPDNDPNGEWCPISVGPDGNYVLNSGLFEQCRACGSDYPKCASEDGANATLFDCSCGTNKTLCDSDTFKFCYAQSSECVASKVQECATSKAEIEGSRCACGAAICEVGEQCERNAAANASVCQAFIEKTANPELVVGIVGLLTILAVAIYLKYPLQTEGRKFKSGHFLTHEP